MDQFLKISNYEDTVKQLDIYYGIVKRQLLQIQSPITGLFPVLSTDKEVGSIRDSVYCAAAIWSLYQAYRWVLNIKKNSLKQDNCTESPKKII